MLDLLLQKWRYFGRQLKLNSDDLPKHPNKKPQKIQRTDK